MKRALFALLLLPAIFSFTSRDTNSTELFRLKQKGKDASEFCKKNNYNPDFCILIDMAQHSGKNRAFIWDMKKSEIIASSLCAHGCGTNPWSGTYTKEKPVFSNVPDSHCTSLGKYKIGKRGYSAWGINVNYLLHGLESTNNNALKREIVLHSWQDVPETEVYPAGTPEGWGCPAVANNFMKIADQKIKASGKPVLLWIFN